MEYPLTPIGTIESCYKEKFGIPRQPDLVREARAILRLTPGRRMRDAVRGLEGFSHVWVIFVFHDLKSGWKPLVRPPRLGGARKIGVLASRSPHRPNPIGLSAVRLERVEVDARGEVKLHLLGGDFLEGTPVLDLKPYLAYADARPRATAGWLGQPAEAKLRVTFAPAAAAACRRAEARGGGYANLTKLIRATLRLDPRPAFQARSARGQGAAYAARLLDFDVHWVVDGDRCRVTSLLCYDSGQAP